MDKLAMIERVSQIYSELADYNEAIQSAGISEQLAINKELIKLNIELDSMIEKLKNQ